MMLYCCTCFLQTWLILEWDWDLSDRVPPPPGKSWILFIENSRTWKVLENHFVPGKSWKLKLEVLECPGKISLKVMNFSSDSNGKQAVIV